MGFRNGAYVTIWAKKMQTVEYYKNGKKASFEKPQLKVSISKADKNQESGYRQTFSGWVDVAGDALEDIKGIKIPNGGIRKRLGNVDLENRCVVSDENSGQPKYTWYWTPIIWSFDNSEDGTAQGKHQGKTGAPKKPIIEAVEEDEDLPF